MAESLQAQMDQLRKSIQGLEAQRSLLGVDIVDPALETLRQKLIVLQEQAAAVVAPAEERCLITILFIDMVGSTSMAEKLDPEDWRQVMVKLHTALGETIIAHHGTVAQYLGDGLLALFGAKETSEYDAENAIWAALDSHASVANLFPVEKIQLRAGIHSGLVVVGELGGAYHREFTASGDAMNLAARLQSAAPAGGILISHDTYRYVRGVFDMEAHPLLFVKGKSGPLQTYLVLRAKPRPFRKVARGVAGVEVRTVGREAEIKALQAAYLQSYQGHNLVWAQLLGDPGVGKSRLLADLVDWLDLRTETTRLLRARAFPDDANQPFTLVRRMWFDRFQIPDDAPLEQAEAKWVAQFKELSRLEDCEEAAHALGLLVGLSFDNSPHVKGMRRDPNQVKGRALVVSRELFQAIRQLEPVVVLLEDLHWTDAASWEYLMEVFVKEATGERTNGHTKQNPDEPPFGLFILGAARPEWCPPQELMALFRSSMLADQVVDKLLSKKWGVQISLAPLSDQTTSELAKELLQWVEDIPEQVISLLVEHSEGVPYYTEEIVNWFIDRGILDTHEEPWRFSPERLSEQPLPATLQQLLLTRLRCLAQIERAALQCGSIFGRRFWTGAVEALGVSTGVEMLGRLQPRGFVELQPESAIQGDTEWSFHHHLLQEVTYESVLKRERLALHKLAANWLERQARQARRLDEFAGLLGYHCNRAGDVHAAAEWYLRAGQRAFGQGAPNEAVGFYSQALELFQPIDQEQRWQALLGREEAHSVLGNAEPWKADITALLELAHSFEDNNYLAEAYLRQAEFAMCMSDGRIGDQASRAALAAARRCGNEEIEVKALSINAIVAFNQGDKTAAKEKTEAAICGARRLGNDSVLAFVLFHACYLYGEVEMGDLFQHDPLQLEQIDLDHRLGNRNREASGLMNLGVNYSLLGLYQQARTLFEQAYQISKALGPHQSLAYNLMNLGEISLINGELQMAHKLLEEALQIISSSNDARGKICTLLYLAKIHLAMGDFPGAARSFSEGRELALSLEMAPLAFESTAGMAASAIMQGQLDEAHIYVHEAWDYLKEHSGVGFDNSFWFYRSIAETFAALGEIENARSVVEKGYQALLEIADKINIPDWRESFLENVPDNRAIIEMWERSKL